MNRRIYEFCMCLADGVPTLSYANRIKIEDLLDWEAEIQRIIKEAHAIEKAKDADWELGDEERPGE